ncbi:MAG: hypothetical protein JWP70_94 [Leifsonia sp.]|nr:hypothetical protein [Leifsonia sp.]
MARCGRRLSVIFGALTGRRSPNLGSSSRRSAAAATTRKRHACIAAWLIEFIRDSELAESVAVTIDAAASDASAAISSPGECIAAE